MKLRTQKLKEITKYYDDYYEKNQKVSHPYCTQGTRPRKAYEVFLDFLKPQSRKKVLDVGCSIGMLLGAARERGLVSFGVDISQKAVELSRQNSPQSPVVKGSGQAMGFKDATFDYVTCVGTLEHFLDIDKGLREIQRISNDDAEFMIVVPNRDSYTWAFRSVKGTEQREIKEHLYTLSGWKERFERNGFEIKRVHRDIWPVYHRLKLKWITKWVLRKLVPLRYTYQFVFISTKSLDKRL